jgi:3-deoxy-D-manno-octulosonic-acid transferase|tara:strand:+ start:124 stop:510 length:387 start_codon:yes stop_codon:yes gene_type:complete
MQLTSDQLKRHGARIRRFKNTRIHTIDLSEANCVVDDSLVQQLQSHTTLVELDLSDSHITNQAVEHLTFFPKLTSLNLENTAINNDCVDTLLEMQQLKLLVLSNTEIAPTIIEEIRPRMINTRIVNVR